MNTKNKPNKVFFNSFLVWLSCLSLLISSCTVRNTLSDIIDIEISKPLSPSKSGSSQDVSSCNYIDSQQIDVKSSIIGTYRQLYNFATDFLSVKEVVSISNSSLDFKYIPKTPKYLLFKKIKIFYILHSF